MIHLWPCFPRLEAVLALDMPSIEPDAGVSASVGPAAAPAVAQPLVWMSLAPRAPVMGR